MATISFLSKNTSQLIIGSILLFIGLIPMNMGLADTLDLPSIGQDVEAQAERLRQEYSFEKKKMEGEFERPSIQFKELEAKPVEGATTFELKEVRITGMTITDPENLRAIWMPYVGKQTSINDIQQMIARLKMIYAEAGLLTSMAYLPPQDIKDGVVEIRVAEGKMGEVLAEGNQWVKTATIKKYFHTKRGEVLNVNKIQADVMRLNENPDLNVKVVLAAGQEPQTSDVTLKVTENRPHHVSVGFDNHGTRLVGKYRKIVTVSSSNLTGHLDQLYLTTIISDHSTGEYAAYRLPVGRRGMKVGLDVGYFETKLWEELKSLDVTGKTKIYVPNIAWEMKRAEKGVINGRAGIKIKDFKKRVGLVRTTDDQLRLPYVAMDFSVNHPTGQTNFSPEISVGTEGFLGASSRDNPIASRQGSGGHFIKYEHSGAHYRRMPWESRLQIKSQFQAATHTLPSSEQMQLGGSSSIRGYPEGDYLADIGGNINVDWIFPMYLIPNEWQLKWSDLPLRRQIQPVIFLDVGGGRLIKALSREVKDKFLAGAGGGFRIQVSKHAYIKMEWAGHFGHKPIRGTGSSVFNISFQMGT